MSSFTELDVKLEDGTNFIVVKEFDYYRMENENVIYTVPAGFETNFASVPKILKLFFSDRDLYSPASVLHDYLYYAKITTRKEADQILREGMIVFGCSKLSANLFYIAVRLFGSSAWKTAKFN